MRYGRRESPFHRYRGDWNADSGYQAGLALANEPDCTAVYAANDQMAYGAILGLQAAGKRVPEDVSVMGVDDSLVGMVPRLGLTTMRMPFTDRTSGLRHDYQTMRGWPRARQHQADRRNHPHRTRFGQVR